MSKYTVERRPNISCGIDAKEVVSVLKTFVEINPDVVVKHAKQPSSPLHKYFEWDDSKAAHSFRLQQARALIASIRIEEDDGNRYPAFLSVTLENHNKAYVGIEKISESEDLINQVLFSALRELRYWSAKHQKLKNFLPAVFDEIKKAEETYQEKINEKVKKGRAGPKGAAVKARRASDKKGDSAHNDNRRLAAAR